MKKMLLFCALVATIVLGIMAYPFSREKSITFTATNIGTEAMRSVVVHITGKSYAIGDLAAGASKSVQLHPGTDSHIELALAEHPRLVVDCYFSGGYTGSIAAEVTVDKVVTVNNATVFGAY